MSLRCCGSFATLRMTNLVEVAGDGSGSFTAFRMTNFVGVDSGGSRSFATLPRFAQDDKSFARERGERMQIMPSHPSCKVRTKDGHPDLHKICGLLLVEVVGDG